MYVCDFSIYERLFLLQNHINFIFLSLFIDYPLIELLSRLRVTITHLRQAMKRIWSREL